MKNEPNSFRSSQERNAIPPMRIKTMEWYDNSSKLTQFLQDELKIAPAAIEMAQRLGRQQLGSMPMILWQYGVLSLSQLEQTWDWLEKSTLPATESN